MPLLKLDMYVFEQFFVKKMKMRIHLGISKTFGTIISDQNNQFNISITELIITSFNHRTVKFFSI